MWGNPDSTLTGVMGTHIVVDDPHGNCVPSPPAQLIDVRTSDLIVKREPIRRNVASR